jgi:hypothetical protein
MAEPTDLFSEPLPRRRRWRIDYELAEPPARGVGTFSGVTPAEAIAALREDIRGEDPEFFAVCEGPSLHVISCKEVRDA